MRKKTNTSNKHESVVGKEEVRSEKKGRHDDGLDGRSGTASKTRTMRRNKKGETGD